MFLGLSSDLENNSYSPLDQFKKHKIIIKDSTGHSIVSNICPHQRSIISKQDGNGARICPYHGWSFTLDGSPLGSGRSVACKNTEPLEKQTVYNCNNMLFSTEVSCKELDFVDFTKFKLVEKRIDRVYNCLENVMDIFLDVDHVALVHKGVYDKIGLPNISSVDWVFYNYGSLQLVKNNFKNDKFKETLKKEDLDLKYGAAWLAIYPGTMIEWQPGAVFVTVCVKVSKEVTDVIIYKYRDYSYGDLNWDINNKVWEDAWSQDKEQVESIVGFNSNNLEDCKKHFRNFLKDYT